ncbi:hypothetical protein DVA67_027005 [Solirubrobacter sp. CPCC 204708]|uniref:Uncharacterized protein n=1 Tax=Solirubrobacter deserti TaxID=2282478 RepID=A0ABT4RGF6_9ACTN|nr:hypothetical protein [Solirubrobacter deserti]MBE2319647.1 hypothetical protein [Solirubrobacter deserti]MDA0137614.1 hypothetical protein [Solirubrobacter deserti]
MRVRPLTVVLCALAFAVGTVVVVTLVVRPPAPPAVRAIELLPGAPTVTPTPTTFAPPEDDDADEDPFDDDE